jgi:hypothetical protein
MVALMLVFEISRLFHTDHGENMRYVSMKKKTGLDKTGKSQYTSSRKAEVFEGYIGAQYLLLTIRP